jgi:phosphoketolase
LVGWICFTGLDHGGPGLLANTFLEGICSAVDPNVYQQADA